MNVRLLFSILVAGVLLSTGAVTWAEGTGETVVSETDIAVIPIDKLYVTQQAMISEGGLALLQAVADARADLRRKDFFRARREVDKAYGLIRAVRSTSPAVRVNDHIAGLRDQLAESGKVSADDLLPIYAELDDYERITGAAAVERTRAILVDAKGHIKAADVSAGMEVLTQVRETLTYLEIDLPIEETYQHLYRARALLRHDLGRGVQRRITPDDIAADKELRATHEHLSAFAAIVELPAHEELKVIGEDVLIAE